MHPRLPAQPAHRLRFTHRRRGDHGLRGLIITDENTCMVDLAKFFLTFTQSESCGRCVPCRLGTKRMLEILAADHRR